MRAEGTRARFASPRGYNKRDRAWDAPVSASVPAPTSTDRRACRPATWRTWRRAATAPERASPAARSGTPSRSSPRRWRARWTNSGARNGANDETPVHETASQNVLIRRRLASNEVAWELISSPRAWRAGRGRDGTRERRVVRTRAGRRCPPRWRRRPSPPPADALPARRARRRRLGAFGEAGRTPRRWRRGSRRSSPRGRGARRARTRVGDMETRRRSGKTADDDWS